MNLSTKYLPRGFNLFSEMKIMFTEGKFISYFKCKKISCFFPNRLKAGRIYGIISNSLYFQHSIQLSSTTRIPWNGLSVFLSKMVFIIVLDLWDCGNCDLNQVICSFWIWRKLCYVWKRSITIERLGLSNQIPGKCRICTWSRDAIALFMPPQ